MKKITREQVIRLRELEIKAQDEFISNSDFIPTDWLDDEEEKREYSALLELFLQ